MFSNKQDKKKAIKDVVSGATNAISEILKDLDYSNADEVIKKGLQIEAIKRCSLAQAQVIAQQPNTTKFKNGGVIPRNASGENVIINIDSTLSPKQQQELSNIINK